MIAALRKAGEKAGPRLLALIVLALLLLVRFEDPSPLERMRLDLFDLYQNARPRALPPGAERPVLILDIDEASLKRFGQWPFSRAILADLVAKARADGAAAIGFDMVFPEPDRLSPQKLAETLPGLSPALVADLKARPDTDALFAEAISGGKVVLGRTGLSELPRAQGEETAPHLPLAVLGGDPTELLPAYPGMLRNLPALEKAAAGVGLFSIIPEPDGIIRRVPMAFAVDGAIRPALSVELLRQATGGDAFAIRRDKAGIEGLIVGGHFIPTERDGRRWVHFTAHAPQRFIPLADFLDGRIAPGRLDGRIVLVGASAIGLQDLRATPLDPAMPGVEIHAQIIESIVTGSLLQRPHLALGVEILAAGFLGLVMILLLPRLGVRLVLLLGLGLAGATIWLGWHLFATRGLLIDTSFPLLAALAVFLTLAFANYWREETARREIRNAFQHYLAPDMVEKLVREPEKLRLGGETRELTILFSDLRGFTAVAESYRDDPQALTQLMNRLMAPLSDAIIAEGGTIDKYMGDAVMAFWNAPLDDADHAAHALAAAREMHRRFTVLETGRRAEDAAAGRAHLPLDIGIGINSGPCVVGNMGSEFRFDYTALGDAVNLAQRLESLTPRYGTPILVGEATAALLQGRAGLTELGSEVVKGKTKAVRVFGVG